MTGIVVASALPAASPASDGESARSAARRIVTISPNSAEIICQLEACDRIVGVDKFCVFPSEVLKKPKVGGLIDPDLEKIVSLRPDLLVLRGRNDVLEKLCKSMDIPLYLDRTETLSDVPRCIEDLGRLLDRNDRADELIERFEKQLRAVKERVAGRHRPTVFITYSREADSFSNVLTAGKGMFLDDAITLAGGVNVFGDLDMRYPQVSPEAIVARRPEVVIELLPEKRPGERLEQQVVSAWRRLGPIPAVQNGRIYILTDDHCLIPSPRYVEIIEKISRLLHPETTTDDDKRRGAGTGP